VFFKVLPLTVFFGVFYAIFFLGFCWRCGVWGGGGGTGGR
jgi:hypothetical protein